MVQAFKVENGDEINCLKRMLVIIIIYAIFPIPSKKNHYDICCLMQIVGVYCLNMKTRQFSFYVTFANSFLVLCCWIFVHAASKGIGAVSIERKDREG